MGVERGLGEGMWGCRYVFEERGVVGFGRGRWVLCGFFALGSFFNPGCASSVFVSVSVSVWHLHLHRVQHTCARARFFLVLCMVAFAWSLHFELPYSLPITIMTITNTLLH